MTIPVSHLPGCYKTSRADPSRYACNCGADSQNELRAMLVPRRRCLARDGGAVR